MLVCSLVLTLVLSRHVREMEGRMQKSLMRRLAGVWVRDTSVEMHCAGGAADAVRAPQRGILARLSGPAECATVCRHAQVVVEAVEMQSGFATAVSLPLQAPAAFAGSGGSIIAATTVQATVATHPPWHVSESIPQPGIAGAEAFVQV